VLVIGIVRIAVMSTEWCDCKMVLVTRRNDASDDEIRGIRYFEDNPVAYSTDRRDNFADAACMAAIKRIEAKLGSENETLWRDMTREDFQLLPQLGLCSGIRPAHQR